MGCGSPSESPTPDPIRQIERMYYSDWPIDRRYTKASRVMTPNVHLWYNFASHADIFSKYSSSVPQKSVHAYRFGSNPQLVYEIQLIASNQSAHYLLLVETFRCTKQSSLDSCVSLTNTYLKSSTTFSHYNETLIPLHRFGHMFTNKGWVVGLRTMVASVSQHNERVDVSDQYASYLT